MKRLPWVMPLCLLSCATAAPMVRQPLQALDGERHFGELHQLTFDGENAEAYWRFDGTGVSFQRRAGDQACDRIYTLPLFEKGQRLERPVPTLVSSGEGATTCAHFLAGDDALLYASTHLGGATCPPRPDLSLGYVWAIYEQYDLFKRKADGSGPLLRLTDSKGYDAEATVCGRDGSILFTSMRDGDLELYRMNADGTNVRRLTNTPGYDGGGFFSADCRTIVWRASRPAPGKELEDYQALLSKGLVRPSKLELYVANADGSDPRQITSLNAASFAPFFFPDGKRVIFSSNAGDPKGREFDLWAVNVDGTGLERITNAPGFDGFPMFSPDGRWLMFSSNRMTPKGAHDTNLFLARWQGEPVVDAKEPARRILDDATWLASPQREGRGLGTAGLEQAAAFLAKRYGELGLEPLAPDFRSPFEVTTAVTVGSATSLVIGKLNVPSAELVPLGFSAQGRVSGKAVLAGYGLRDPELGLGDYAGLDVKGKIVIVRRFTPAHPSLSTPDAQRRAGDLRKKAFVAKSLGALALIVVDRPAAATQAEAALPVLRAEGSGDAGLPVLVVRRSALESVWSQLEKKKPISLSLEVALTRVTTQATNLVGLIRAERPTHQEPIIIGAHYDHLGLGGAGSLTPDTHEPHLGADDNASGVATLLEIARQLGEKRATLTRDVAILAFSGEEAGLPGSAALVRAAPPWLQKAPLMINLDMVGRLKDNALFALGTASAPELGSLVRSACDRARVRCSVGGDGYGPSDHTSFYAAGIPVVHFFTGAHGDYHKPSDAPDKLNALGMATVAHIVTEVTLAAMDTPLTYAKLPEPSGHGDARSFNASLGTVPNYAGPPAGVRGVLLDDVRPGGGAAQAGMKRGDVIQKLGTHDIGSVDDLMFVLMQAKPGQTVTAIVLRDGQRLELETTFQEGKHR